ncbi:MAG: hypothetical protein IKN26_02190 [Eubacterium sp.]|nr:hypothetical protein [Eubacterium sp.]MBR4241053.1 hypothetical protein [Eubacterium sp.]MBR7060477.1 hypothetical protein [Eubacterium sp.]
MDNNSTKAHWYKIKCPFFKGDNFNSINCEGSVEKSIIRQSFKNKIIKEGWQARYCMEVKGCEACPIHKVAYEKYN